MNQKHAAAITAAKRELAKLSDETLQKGLKQVHDDLAMPGSTPKHYAILGLMRDCIFDVMGDRCLAEYRRRYAHAA